MGTEISDHAEDLFVQLANDYSDEGACRWIRRKFESFSSAAAFDVACEEKIEQNNFTDARVLGYVTELRESKSSAANRPLLVASVYLKKGLAQRTSRLAQFNFAKKIIKKAIDSGRHNLSGVPSQGIFFFHDELGNFRISLVSGQIDAKNKFVFNSAKRQSFVVNPGAPNNIVRRRLNPVINSSFEAVKEAFSVDQLTKEFYNKLFAWYQWAMQEDITPHPFPNDTETDADDREMLSEGLIRLITRLMFVWFIKQKGLVPKELFLPEAVKTILKKFNPGHMAEDNYYRCILQNLFFATLNCPKLNAQGKRYRKFMKVFMTPQGPKSDEHGVKTCYRYRDEFVDPDGFVEFMMKVPFLNCALFDCLDRDKKPEEGKGMLLIDGFSQRGKKYMAHLPNGLFFDGEKGLIKLFNQYEFTVDENNADDSDVALDPELLGKVFENLLGAFNPETKETARKSTGSFYTPREIVDYMVDESLKNYIKTKVPSATDEQLDDLFDRSKANEINTRFNEDQRKAVLEAVLTCRILDPACGSGAFPMGILHCMVRLLDRLDPNCRRSNEMLYARYTKESRERDPSESEEMVEERRRELESRSREELRNPAYARKLYLIENCIYGVDIQPVATQISKLRFFISLLCDQFKSNYDPDAENAGLLSLPNLEAKFVCANTLISLPKLPEDELALSKENVKDKQEELRRNRHRIFGARTAGTKAKYKAQDLQIRRDIENIVKTTFAPDAAKIELLNKELTKLTAERAAVAEPRWVEAAHAPKKVIQDDWFASPKPEQQALPLGKVDVNEPKRAAFDRDIKNIKQSIEKELQKGKSHNQGAIDEFARLVASWDPFDQNATSSYFDPEWMFGLKDGFDIVIGNPPYVLIDKTEYSKKYSAFFRYQSGKIDLYRLFMEKAFISLASSSGAVVSYITPNSFLAIPSCKMLRRCLLQDYSFDRIVNYDEDVFDGVSVNSVVFVASTKSAEKGHSIYVSPNGNLTDFYSIDQAECLANSDCAIRIFQSKAISAVLKKMAACSKTVGGSKMDLCLGEQPYHNTIHTKDQMDSRFLHSDHKVNSSYLQELGGRDISKYRVTRARSVYLNYAAELYTKPPMKYFSGERIIIREIPGETLVCAYATEEFLVNKSCYVLKNDEKSISYLALLSILNSRLVGFWIANSGEKTNQNLFPRVSMASLKAIPLPCVSSSNDWIMSEVASKIVAAKKADPNADTSALEAEIDQLVYKLYDLTPEEIAIVEGRGEAAKTSAAKDVTEKAQAPRKVKQTKPSLKTRDDEWMD